MPAPKRVGELWVEYFNKKDIGKLMSLYAANAKNSQSHLPAPLKGRDAIQTDLHNFMKAFSKGKMKVVSVAATKDTLAMEWTFTGVHDGPLVGPMGTLPPTNKKVTLTGGEFIKFNPKGLIVDERGYFDTGSFMTQLGMGGAPPPAPEPGA